MSDDRARVEKIRAQLSHPVIDSDGHDVEYLPLVREELRALAGQSAVDRFELMVRGAQLMRGVDDTTRRAQGLMRIPWWGLPAENTLDRATALLPRLLHERLDALGLDFAVIYPTLRPDGALRRARRGAPGRVPRLQPLPRGGVRGPRRSPHVSGADPHAHARGGDRGARLRGDDARLQGRAARGPRAPPAARRERAARRALPRHVRRRERARLRPRLGALRGARRRADVPLVGDGLGQPQLAPRTTSSTTSATSRPRARRVCRSLFLHGVPQRFPRLRFAFLEGGAAGPRSSAPISSATSRSATARRSCASTRPGSTARASRELCEATGRPRVVERLGELDANLHLLSEPGKTPRASTSSRRTGVTSAEDVRRASSPSASSSAARRTIR